MNPAQRRPVSTLRLVPTPAWSPDYPRLTILVDGESPWESARPGRLAQIAGDLLDAPALDEPCALEPTVVPRHVAIAVCSCGEEGCDNVSPLIVRSGDHVEWRDFISATGWFAGALGPRDEPFGPGQAVQLPLPSIRFDYGQYMTEVRRLQVDRSWESVPARYARIVRESLWRARADARVQDTWVTARPSSDGELFVRWSGRDAGGFWYRDARLVPDDDRPDDWLDRIVETIGGTPFHNWMSAHAGPVKRLR